MATAQTGDTEMAVRIARHQQARGARWQTLEAPLDLTAVALTAAGHGGVLVDCITLWLTNLLLADERPSGSGRRWKPSWPPSQAAGAADLVSNEVGQGIVPDIALARTFRDLAGQVNQRLAARADHVWLVTAGLPLQLK